ncbi:ChaB family protein [Desulfonatronovibrio magnus]|uniref:ChaB family protein n=1 Tax=Desulfonatronovibrio magnus TaxID=698827 RepID=UPI0005EAE867|nr:ChaB family protein [Desulfonatronovibrio magnus]
MPYDKNSKLPDQVKNNLPQKAQTIYRKAFNAAWDQYESPAKRRGDADREETAHRVAWSAVKKSYQKDEQGRWVPKKS